MTQPIYIPNYASTAPHELQTWADSLRWVRKSARRRELFMHDPSQVAGPLRYSYVPKHTYFSQPADDVVDSVMRAINADVQISSQLGMGADEFNPSLPAPLALNVCFLNRYDNARQALGWHSDDEDSLDDSQPIAVVSFGAARAIHIRAKGAKGPATERYMLEHGSLFVMPPGHQETHEHSIPGHTEPVGMRVSLTYRSMFIPEHARVSP